MKYPSIHCEDRRTPHQKSGRKTNVWTEQLGVRQVSLSLIISQVAQVTTEHGQLFFLIKNNFLSSCDLRNVFKNSSLKGW